MGRKPGTKQRRLNIYLIRDELIDPIEAIKDRETLKEYKIKGLGQLFVRQSKSNPPGWASIFEGVVDFSGISLINSSTAATLLVKASSRIFAITFGFGKSLLIPGCYEERFGLKVCLNSINPESIRSIDKKTFDSISRHSRVQASREASASEFGLDIEQDLLRAVTGTPVDNTLGNKMTGIDALNVTIHVELDNVPALLASLYIKYQEKSYQKTFPWVDQIAEVTDKSSIKELDESLITAIKQNKYDRLWMALPEIIDWTDVKGFKYSESAKSSLYSDIDIPSFIQHIRDANKITSESIRHYKAFCYSESNDIVIKEWPIYQCLYCEIEHKKGSYLLNGGNWYKIESDYIEQVNRDLTAIPLTGITLPPYNDLTEKAYNERVCNTDKNIYALMDCKTIPYGGGYSKFEFCDIFTNNKKMIHIKKYGGSSVLSHLFSQGAVSGELFYLDRDFRASVNKLLPTSHKLSRPEEQPVSSEYEIIFGIISSENKDIPTLPMFSKINLRRAARQLNGYGYKVTMAKIPILTHPTK